MARVRVEQEKRICAGGLQRGCEERQGFARGLGLWGAGACWGQLACC